MILAQTFESMKRQTAKARNLPVHVTLLEEKSEDRYVSIRMIKPKLKPIKVFVQTSR